jgi:glutamyl-tRNA reductase
MSFIAIGINHQTAPIAIREKVAFTPTTLVGALKDYAGRKKQAEIVILSTCNRTEVFANTEQVNIEDLTVWLAQIHQVELALLGQYLYTYENEEAIIHLMQVACGLDSLILGEPQILGQVKQAFSEAKHVGTVNGYFEKIFQTTFTVAKKVRTQTDIGANAVSVAYAAVQLAKQIFSDLSNTHVMLIGAGETIELVAKHLAQYDLKKITVANRTLANAQVLADVLPTDSEAITISEIPERLSKADIVISSTASALPILGQGTVASALKERKFKPMLMIDLAVPRDIEEQVSEIDDVYLYTVDDLQHIVQQNVANREQAATEANKIIHQYVSQLAILLKQHKKVDLIKAYRDEAEITRQQLEDKALVKLAQGEAPEKVLQELSYKLSQAMMHSPTKAMQRAIVDPKANALDVLEDIFGQSNK